MRREAAVIGFANIDDPKLADAVIEQLNGKDFGGTLRVERSERRDSNAGGNRRRNDSGGIGGHGQSQVARKAVNKVVHSDAPGEAAPDPRWAGELSKLKDLLADRDCGLISERNSTASKPWDSHPGASVATFFSAPGPAQTTVADQAVC